MPQLKILVMMSWQCACAFGAVEADIFKSGAGICLTTQLASAFVLTKRSPEVLFLTYF